MTDNIVILAKQIATEAHKGQFRRDGITPYIVHPQDVANRVDSTDSKVVAWLHDVIEDCDITSEELKEKGFSNEQVNAIKLLTKTKGITYEQYLDNICKSPLATNVKIADMISNLADSPTDNQIKKYAIGLYKLTRNMK